MARRALIVDDNRALAEDLGEILELEGYEVAVFDDPSRALVECEERVFDVALLDVRMPGLDGVGLHRRLLERHPHTAFILMTAYTEDDRIASALSAGVRRVLIKPVVLPELLRALEEEHGGDRNLLLVEDDVELNARLSKMLSAVGYRVHSAHCLAEARQLAQGGAMFAAIVDLHLPDGDGAEFAGHLARTAPKTSVILVTGDQLNERDGPLIKSLGERVHVLVKPFLPDALLEVLDTLHGEAA